MRSIFGRIQTDQTPVNSELFKRSIENLSVLPFTETEFYVDKNAALGQVNFHGGKNLLDKPFHDDFLLISDSIIYNKNELARNLELSEEEVTDDLILLKSYIKWKEKCVNHLVGDFAFALWNKKNGNLFCARDHLGVKPLHYYFDGNQFIFSTDIRSVLLQDDLSFSPDEQHIADTLSIIKSEKDRTTYKEIKRLPPAHYLTLKNNSLEINNYWKLEKQTVNAGRETDIIGEFKNRLTEAVKCRVKIPTGVGSELSGGIDSSTVTALASNFTNITTFSHVLPDHLLGKIHPFKDERKYVALLADYCNLNQRNFITSEESLLKTLREHIINYQSLSQQNFGIFSDQLYEAAQNNKIKVLLSGFGGDEVVTSKSAGYLKELAANNRWEELKYDLKNQFPKRLDFFKKYFKIVIKKKIPRAGLLRFKPPWWKLKYSNLALNHHFEKKRAIKRRYYDYYQSNREECLQARNIERITHPHVSQRLEYCALAARRHGIEYRYPLLDIRLIEYYLSVPTRLKARNGIGRYIIRRAVEGIVPEKIQWRNDKSGATIPTVFMRTLNDKKQIEEIIQRAKNNELIKKYIDVDNYEKWFLKLCKRSETENKFINPGAFYNYLKLMLFIENNPSLFA